MSYEDLLAKYERVREALIWNSAIVTIMLQDAGGKFEVDKGVLQNISMDDIWTEVRFDVDREVYIIEGGIKNES